MRKVSFIILSLLWTQSLIFAQTSEPKENTITIKTSTSKWYSPDELKISITLTEYIHTDPVTQESTSIELETIRKTVFKKLLKFDIEEKDIVLTSIQKARNNFNAAGYSSTQKRSLSIGYEFDWNQETDKLQGLYEALRLNGVSGIYVQTSFSRELIDKIEIELTELCIEKGKKDADKIAEKIGRKIGKIKSISTSFYSYETAASPAYYNYNSVNQINFGTLKKSQKTMNMQLSMSYM